MKVAIVSSPSKINKAIIQLLQRRTNTMRVFVSQPMKDKTNEEIVKERENAIRDIKARFKTDDVEIIDSFFKDAPHDSKPLWYLSKSLELLSTADAIYLCRNWRDYRGCRIEYECAIEYGIPIVECVVGSHSLLNSKHEQNSTIMKDGTLCIEYIDTYKVGVIND